MPTDSQWLKEDFILMREGLSVTETKLFTNDLSNRAIDNIAEGQQLEADKKWGYKGKSLR